jgi:hypothetical protein
MSFSSTATKIGGLVVALGFFGLGPGSVAIEEIVAKVQKHRQQQLEQDESNVRPPGEEEHEGYRHKDTSLPTTISPPPRTYTKHMNEHAVPIEVQDYVTHPFLPVTATKLAPKAKSAATIDGDVLTATNDHLAENHEDDNLTPSSSEIARTYAATTVAAGSPTSSSSSWLSFLVQSDPPNNKD